ncbi:MAG: VapC toxin family PIN domain ribonuclease [Betaproteobacteria bacterium]|nr:VapC toxin family PIN domain ribonuclease [Betaproteobacteria bacterium]
MFFSAVGEAELRYGVAIMPDGRNKRLLESKIDSLVQETFAERILPFDRVAASIFVQFAVMRRAVGLAVALADIQIAAIARSCGMSVATRDTKGFAGMGIEIINPWTDA